MISKATERQNFIAQLTRALPATPAHVVAHQARLLMRAATTHARLAEFQCNGIPQQSMGCPYKHGTPEHAAYWASVDKMQREAEARAEKREQRIERRITAICADLGIVPKFGGDPRGYTVKVGLPNGAHNTWGGAEDGWGVPQ